MSLQTGSDYMRAPAGSSFPREIWQFPILEAEQEYLLAKRYHKLGDQRAANQLITSHLRLVWKLARGYRGYGLPLADLISEGTLGLIHATKRFDPERGVRLAAYATWWIKAAMHEYILHSWSLVKMGTTTNQRKLFFKLRRAKALIGALEPGDLRPQHARLIASRLRVAEQEVVEMNRRLDGDISLNSPIRRSDSSEAIDSLIDDNDNQEAILANNNEFENRRLALKRAMTVLSQREQRVFVARHLSEEPASLSELAEEFDVSRERIRQIEQRSFEKIRSAIKKQIAEVELRVILR